MVATPESGTVDVGALTVLRFEFSEKMDRTRAESWLVLYPPVPIRDTDWDGARVAKVELQEPLPADTVVVVEIRPGMKDMRRVANRTARRWPIATGAKLPDGEIRGGVVYADQPLPGGVVELFPVPPDTVRWFQQDLLRRTQSDSTGRWSLGWLDVPAGPFLLRIFRDGDGDLRAGENDPSRLLPDTLFLTVDAPRRDLGVIIVYDPDAPGTVIGPIDSLLGGVGSILGWAEAYTAEDTTWSAMPLTAAPPGQIGVAAGTEATFSEVPPGQVRVILFVDVDGDSLLSVLPVDSTLAVAMSGTTYVAATDTPGEARIDTVVAPVEWLVEPHALVDSLILEPGREVRFASPTAWRRDRPWFGPIPPAPVDADSLAAAMADSLAAMVDSLQALADSLVASQDTTQDTTQDATQDTSGLRPALRDTQR